MRGGKRKGSGPKNNIPSVIKTVRIKKTKIKELQKAAKLANKPLATFIVDAAIDRAENFISFEKLLNPEKK